MNYLDQIPIGKPPDGVNPDPGNVFVFFDKNGVLSVKLSNGSIAVASYILNRITGLVDGCAISTHSRDISSIQGDGGVPNTVTVDTVTDHDLITGDIIDVSGTSNYDEIDLTITVITTTQFTYQTSSHTVSSQEVVGAIGDKRRFDIAEGEGRIVDVSDPTKPTLDVVIITAKRAVLDTFLVSVVTYISINSDGDVVQQNVISDADKRRELICLGRVVKESSKIVLSVNSPIVAYGLGKTFEDFLVSHGGIALSESLKITVNGTNLKLDNSSGVIISTGRGFVAGDKNRPNTADVAAQSPIPTGLLFKLYVDGSGDLITNSSSNDIDPDNYNDGGTLTTMPVGKYSVQRMFLFPGTNVLSVYYGPQAYNSLSAAQASLFVENFTENEGTLPGAFRGWLIVQEGITDLQTAITNGKALIIDAGILRPSVAGGADAQFQPVSGQYSDSNNQKPAVTAPILVTFDTTADVFGIEHTDGTGSFKFTISGRYDSKAQPQIERTGSGGSVFFHLWVRIGKKDGLITSIGTGANAPIASKDHRLQTGQQLTISNVVTTPDINGLQTVTVIDNDTYHIGVNITNVTDGVGDWTRDLDILDDLANSNVETNLQNVLQSDVLPLIFNNFYREEDVLEFYMSVSDATKGGGLVAKTPAGEPAIPSIIFDILKIGID